jgi:hypothetical protein
MRNRLRNNLTLRQARQIEFERETEQELRRAFEEKSKHEQFIRQAAEEEARRARQEAQNRVALSHDQQETLGMLEKSQGSMVLVLVDGRLQAKMSGDYLEIIELLWSKNRKG